MSTIAAPVKARIVATVNGKQVKPVIDDLLAYDLNQPYDRAMLFGWLEMVQREARKQGQP